MVERTNTQANSLRLDVPAMVDGWASVGHGTLPRRLANALRRAVNAGVLPAGWRLPPERTLANDLSVSRTTVTQALDELRGEGLLTSTQGRGTFVAGGHSAGAVGSRVADHLEQVRGIDLANANPPDLSHLPPVHLDMSTLTAEGGGSGTYALGLPAMRSALAALHSAGGFTGKGRPTGPEQIHVTAGAHQAMSLLVTSLVGRGGAVALAHFNYPGVFDIFDGCGIRPLPLRTDRAGIVPDELERVIAEHRPTALYLQGGAHNPTGTITPTSRLRIIAEIADRNRLTVIEDNTLARLTYGSGTLPESAPPSIADLCRSAEVVWVGSLSKVCWAGLRLGWFRAAEPTIERTMYHHLAIDLGPSAPSQLIALGLLPHLDTIVAGRQERLALAVDAAMDHVAATMSDVTVDRPQGGSVLWMEFPVYDSGPLVMLARRHGVHVAPGSISAPGRIPTPFVRISIDRPIALLREGIDRLARAWHEYRDDAPRVVA